MTPQEALALGRAIERERCARLADAMAAHYMVNGRIPRGSKGAAAHTARAIAQQIRLSPDHSTPPPASPPVTGDTHGTL